MLKINNILDLNATKVIVSHIQQHNNTISKLQIKVQLILFLYNNTVITATYCNNNIIKVSAMIINMLILL